MTNPGFSGPDPFAPGPSRPGGPVPNQPGPQQPVFGQSGAQQSGFGPSPAPAPPAPLPPVGHRQSPPVTVWLSLVFLVIAAGLCVVQAVLGVRAAARSGVDDAQVTYLGREIADLSTTAIVLTALLAIAFALAYLGFGYAVWRGRSWPAPLGTVLAALSLFGLMGGPVIIALVVAGVLAVVFLWLPQSRAYARAGSAAAAAPAEYDPWGGR